MTALAAQLLQQLANLGRQSGAVESSAAVANNNAAVSKALTNSCRDAASQVSQAINTVASATGSHCSTVQVGTSTIRQQQVPFTSASNHKLPVPVCHRMPRGRSRRACSRPCWQQAAPRCVHVYRPLYMKSLAAPAHAVLMVIHALHKTLAAAET